MVTSMLGLILGIVGATIAIVVAKKVGIPLKTVIANFPVREQYRGDWRPAKSVKIGMAQFTGIQIGTTFEYLYIQGGMLSPLQIPWSAFSKKEPKGDILKLTIGTSALEVEIPHDSISTGAKAQLGLRM